MNNVSIKWPLVLWSLVSLIAFSSISYNAKGTTYTSQGTGDWDTPSTWSPSGPPGLANNDVVEVAAGHTVTKNGDLTPNNNGNVFHIYGSLVINGTLDVKNNLVFNIYSGGSLTITNITADQNADLTINGGGSATVTGNMTFGDNATVDVDGSLTVDGNVIVGSGSTLGGDGDVDFGTCSDSDSGFCSMGPLPVELVYFNAKQNGSEVIIEWSTASELNNDVFTIEKSRNGKHFEFLGTIPGSGTDNLSNDYQFIDENPYLGLSYYRLVQTDFDGTTEQFPFVSVLFTPNKEKISVHPNPIRGRRVQLRSSGKEENELMTLRITNLQGRLIKEQQVTADAFGNVDLQIDLENLLKKNTYIVELISNSAREHIKVVGE